MTGHVETQNFQAETRQLLDLMIHSLYTNKEIFLRELISNASDALDRYRLASLVDASLIEPGEQLEIRLRIDPAARTLTISDSGIGMTRDEVVAHIGTIARSGTREAREALRAAATEGAAAGSAPDANGLIGQFGVGFYSAFMAAERVELVTRRAGTTVATRWSSRGEGAYELSEASRDTHGTTITLHLRAADPAAGLDDFADKWRISMLVKRYSDFIAYPIVFEDWREEPVTDPEGKPLPGEPTSVVVQDKVLNSRTPIWTRPAHEVTPAEYQEFYRHLAHDWNEPMKVLTYRAEGRHEYVALLFIPSQAAQDLYYHAPDAGLRLCSQRVVVVEKTPDLLPRFLRFLRGIVDATDLPLNISRQRLQQDRDIASIRRWLTKKVLDSLAEMQRTDAEAYRTFWKEFGRAIKEGVGTDAEHKDRLLGLLLFESSHDATALTTLQGYVDRMPADQDRIFYLTGESRAALEHSPHLEAVLAKGYEVLYLTDPVDELLVQYVPEFHDRKLKSIGKGQITLGSEEERKQAEERLEASRAEFDGLLRAIEGQLEAHVKHARLSARLVTTPACLVVEDHDYSPQLERLLQKGKGGGLKQRRVLELNAAHPLCQKLLERHRAMPDDPNLRRGVEILFGAALIAEGSALEDPVQFTRALFELVEHGL